MKKSLTLILALAMTLSLLTGCGSTSASTGGSSDSASNSSSSSGSASTVKSKSNTSIVIALQGEPTTMDTQYPDDTNMRWVTWNVYEPLYKMDGATLEMIPVLATSYKNVDDKTWEFELRQGVKFHDGSTFTADDAAYSVNRIINTDYGSQIASDFSTIDHAEVVDADTIRIVTKEPDPILMKRLAKLDMVSKAFTEGKSKEDLTTVANGTGPYKLDGWNRGVDVTISAFDGYWGEKGSITNATFRFIEEASTRVSALETGEVDLAANMLPEYVEKLPKVFTGSGMERYFMRFNEAKGVFADKNLRLAANYAVDKQAIADELFKGYATPLQGQINKEGDFGYTDAIKMYPYDIKKAQELIKASGYKGEEIELISEKSRWIKDGEVTEAVASMLQAAGLNVQVKFVSWNQWLDTLFDKTKTPDLMFSSTSSEFMDADRAYSSGVLSTGTQSAVNNPALDTLINSARNEMDSAKRQGLYDQLNQTLFEDPPKLLLVNVNDLHGGVSNLDWSLRKDGRIYLSEMTLQ